jgi:pimeloyl-ACP methyl ester carboxylesterase
MTTPWTRTPALDVIGVKTAVFEAGPEDAAPIVFLHGNPDTHDVWSAVVSKLAETHRCIAPDLPDFGSSIAPVDFDVSLDGQARWVNALFEALELQRAHLVVHDVGGTYGLAFASEHPTRLSALTILNSTFFSDYRWHFWARMWRMPRLRPDWRRWRRQPVPAHVAQWPCVEVAARPEDIGARRGVVRPFPRESRRGLGALRRG